MLALSLLLFFGTLIYTALLTNRLIPLLRAKKMGQSILKIGPVWHKDKEGTPTMGGIVFLTGIVIFSLLGCFFVEKEALLPLGTVLLFAVLNGVCGIIDDASKLKNKQNQGLLPWQKLVLQSAFAFLFLYLWEAHIESALPLYRPFLSLFIDQSLVAFFLLFLLLVGTVNCTNLTDGIAVEVSEEV